MAIIDPDKPIVTIPVRKVAPNQPTTQKGEFDAIFRQTVDSHQIKRADTKSTPLISDIRPAKFAADASPTINRVVDQVQGLIDTLTVYQHKLMERGASLKEIQPLVEKMASQNETLRALASGVGKQDRLKTIVNQSSMVVSMEIAKYKSGHYNDD